MERAPEKCILCGATEREPLVRRGDWTVRRCMGCGLGVLDPRPGPGELSALYGSAYFVKHFDAGLAPGSEAMRRRLAGENHRVRFFRPLRKSGRVLDVGCGRGYFLLRCRELGYDVEGFDVSSEAASYVRDMLGIPVRTGSFESAPFEEGACDVVTMWHALEHTADPRVYLDRAHRLLRPDGVLVVDVPNYRGTDARIKGADWEDWDLPYHFFHFTKTTLDALLAAHGFTVVRRKDYHSEWVKARLKRIPVIGLFARTVAKCFSGSSYAVAACKMDGRERG